MKEGIGEYRRGGGINGGGVRDRRCANRRRKRRKRNENYRSRKGWQMCSKETEEKEKSKAY